MKLPIKWEQRTGYVVVDAQGKPLAFFDDPAEASHVTHGGPMSGKDGIAAARWWCRAADGSVCGERDVKYIAPPPELRTSHLEPGGLGGRTAVNTGGLFGASWRGVA